MKGKLSICLYCGLQANGSKLLQLREMCPLHLIKPLSPPPYPQCETIVEQHEDEVIEFFAHETDNVKDKLCSKRTGIPPSYLIQYIILTTRDYMYCYWGYTSYKIVFGMTHCNSM